MLKADVEFGDGQEGRRKRDEFSDKCKSPMFVAESILKYQNWRRGKGRYAFNDDPGKNAPPPFCAEAIGIIEDAAIKFLMHYDGTVRNGKNITVTDKGRKIMIDVDITLKEVKSWTKEDILHKWIEANRPCTFIYGFAYKGAKARLITKEEALEKIKTHSFGIGYYSMEWTVFDGMAVLQFSEYSESDLM